MYTLRDYDIMTHTEGLGVSQGFGFGTSLCLALQTAVQSFWQIQMRSGTKHISARDVESQKNSATINRPARRIDPRLPSFPASWLSVTLR